MEDEKVEEKIMKISEDEISGETIVSKPSPKNIRGKNTNTENKEIFCQNCIIIKFIFEHNLFKEMVLEIKK